MKTFSKSICAAATLLSSLSAPAQEALPPGFSTKPNPGVSMDAVDTNKDGKVSRAEAQKSMPWLLAHFDTLDKDKDGQLTKDEIMRKSDANRGVFTEEAFKAADTNSDGKLGKEEAEAGMPRAAALFTRIDGNSDGFLTQEEMRAFMREQAKSGGPGTTD